MNIHIERVIIQQPPSGLLSMLGLLRAQEAPSAPSTDIPAIGDKWPGLDAKYGGISLSKNGDKLIHLILWPHTPEKSMDHPDSVKWAEGVRPDMESHVPTRHQNIDLFDRLQGEFRTDDWYWCLEKLKSGLSAFIQHFDYGSQVTSSLTAKGLVRAVSEIQL